MPPCACRSVSSPSCASARARAPWSSSSPRAHGWPTRSLLRIGHVIDVHRVGAAFIAATAMGRDAEGVAAADGYSRLLLPGGEEERFPPEQRV